ncbi:polysaccharide export outer membrane protein [Dysgonomonas sp. PFB1-18]|uniref:polysaccharide biosynthesis/export family protein n=1 Tax=unclassified Dysgonomonas TaxID=2630389 RepID=UPI00247390B3|nr:MULTISPECIES: polysaccharide biosynthesis/export family protein [unclassified Dysgonomonas]MDL2303146.1 polysaccharide biosynthesis/export family protein [Dysgonomonas sp. OttesenSCG-928-D17]MDH6308166.1 polysaccharide export outer membrane protein [Dysgonomonas sp. PF1-14]MDH6338395.1 polysaccharide export outer membrane protein [Dysgonomonas sp. PF1-16]MDH6379892.1 polysaccharide export outer membrane protein [Dysgonomonas sp. PFB1-18]MDH6397018.1 polysaccharide export outer membrane prot
MKNVIKIFLILVCVYAFSSCVTNRETDLLQDIKLNYPQLTVKAEEYKIIPGDQLSIVVYAWDPEVSRMFAGYTPRLSYRGLNESTDVSTGSQIRNLENTDYIAPVTVYADGSITFPYIGKVYVQGLTMLQAKNIISEKLNTFSEGTTADVTLANRYFSVLGETGANRITMTSTSMTIFQALAIASTIGPYGDRSKVTIIRQNAKGSVSKTFDLRSKDIIDTEFYYIQPNDVLYIPQTSKKFFGSTANFPALLGLLLSVGSVIVVILRAF